MHRSSCSRQVICIGFVENSSQVVSLDRGGQLLLWKYHTDYYSGYGWFRPSTTMQAESWW